MDPADSRFVEFFEDWVIGLLLAWGKVTSQIWSWLVVGGVG